MKAIDFFIVLGILGFLFVGYSGFILIGFLGFLAVGILAGLRFFDYRATNGETGATGEEPYDPPFGGDDD